MINVLHDVFSFWRSCRRCFRRLGRLQSEPLSVRPPAEGPPTPRRRRRPCSTAVTLCWRGQLNRGCGGPFLLPSKWPHTFSRHRITKPLITVKCTDSSIWHMVRSTCCVYNHRRHYCFDVCVLGKRANLKGPKQWRRGFVCPVGHVL